MSDPTPTVESPSVPADLDSSEARRGFKRREVLACAATGVAALAAGKYAWDREEAMLRAEVFIAKAASYDDDLVSILREGWPSWASAGPGSGVSRSCSSRTWSSRAARPRTINTHPAVVRAAAEVFRRWDAREVFVAEGQGHCRDIGFVLEQSGLGADPRRGGARVRRPEPRRRLLDPEPAAASPASASSTCPPRSAGPT